MTISQRPASYAMESFHIGIVCVNEIFRFIFDVLIIFHLNVFSIELKCISVISILCDRKHLKLNITDSNGVIIQNLKRKNTTILQELDFKAKHGFIYWI